MSKTVQIFRRFNHYDCRFTTLLQNQAMIVQNGLVLWMGSDQQLSKALREKLPQKVKTHETVLKNQLVLPAFIECHTHSIFAGSRADEFELRNNGVSYLEIASRGGGILSTMKKTRAASKMELEKRTQSFINRFLQQGVATVEIKTGYALDLKNEIKLLEVIESLRKKNKVNVISTYLGPHALPPEFQDHSAYLKFIADQVLPVLKKKKLTNRADIFIEEKFFSASQAEIYLQKAKDLGFHLTIHANQLSQSGGAELALQLQAQSADHVIHLSEATIQKFSSQKTIPVLLPAADLYMKCPYPPARKLIDAGTEVALATDFNPGSCPTQDLMLVGLLARLEMKMTLPEVFRAYTVGAAKALGIFDQEGDLSVGKKAQFLATDAALTDFFYSAGFVPNHQMFINGKKLN